MYREHLHGLRHALEVGLDTDRVMFAHGTPEEVAEDWARGLSGAGEKIRRGVQNVQTAPGVLAARAGAKWAANVAAARPKFEANVGRVSLQEWQDSMLNKGLPRVATGAQAAQPKMASFMGRLLPYIDRGVPSIKAMPSATVEDGIARATAWIRYMGNFSNTGTGG